MGTDITLYAEIKNDGQWKPIPEPTVREWSEGKIIPVEPIDLARPYELFCVMAGAACHKAHTVCDGMEVKMISEPRGLPDDMSSFYQGYFNENEEELDCTFCHSWLMVREIIDFDWDNQFIIQTGTWNTKYWSGNYEENLTKHYDSFSDREILETKHNKLDAQQEIITITWKENYRQFVGCSEQLIEELLELGSPDKIRIIFWFDN